VTVGELIVNKAKYDALPTDLKEILKTTIQAAYWIHFVPFQEKDIKGVRRTDRVGRQGDQDDRRAQRPVPEGLRRDHEWLRGQGPLLQKLVDSQKKYAGLVVPYRLTYWPPYNFIAEHYRKEKIWLK
jgi:hypothetical protein